MENPEQHSGTTTLAGPPVLNSTEVPAVASTQAGAPQAIDGTQRGNGWTAVSDADYDVIRRRRPDCAGSVFSAWYVLVREARFRRALSFFLADSILADRTSVSRNTAIKCRRILAELKLLRFRQKRRDAVGNEATEYLLTPSVSPVRTSAAPCSTDEHPLVQCTRSSEMSSLLQCSPGIPGRTHDKRNDRTGRLFRVSAREAGGPPPTRKAECGERQPRTAGERMPTEDKSTPAFMGDEQ